MSRATSHAGEKPPTLDEAIDRGLAAENGVHTFSNGTEYEGWADRNCFECQHYDPDEMGACAFESAAFIDFVTPELARLFGWVQDPKYDEPNDHRHGWSSPEKCAFFRDKDLPPIPFNDPDQLTIAAEVVAS